MNKKGFTLIELLAVIALLGLLIGIAVPGITRASINSKKKIFFSKIKNIEKTAVLFSYDDEHDIDNNKINDSSGFETPEAGVSPNLCNSIDNCTYYKINDSYTITVKKLVDEGYLKSDEKDDSGEYIITDPTGTNTNLNACKIQIYKKYNKVYAVVQYDDECEKVS